MKGFNYKQFLAEGLLFKEENEAVVDQWWNSLDPQNKKEICEEICGYEQLKNTVAEWWGYYGSENLSAEDCEKCYDEIWNELAPDEKKYYMDKDSQQQQQPLKEGESKYPKAEKWLSEHPDVEVCYSIDDAVGEESEDPETDAMENGFMFISELEALLNSSSDAYDDEYILTCCESGVIDDPDVNPPVDSYDY